MASTVQTLYAALTAAITCTINSLAASATIGRCGTAVDNTTNKYTDALVTVGITTGAGAVGGSKAAYVYVYGSEDGTAFEEEEGNSPAVDGAYNVNSPTIFRLAATIPVATASKLYQRVFSVARCFGGVMPRKWGIIVINDTGQTLAASGNFAQYTGVNPTF